MGYERAIALWRYDIYVGRGEKEKEEREAMAGETPWRSEADANVEADGGDHHPGAHGG